MHSVAAAAPAVPLTSPRWYHAALVFGVTSLLGIAALAVGVAWTLVSGGDGAWTLVLVGAAVVGLAARALLRIRRVEMTADGLLVSGGVLRRRPELVPWEHVAAIAVVSGRHSFAWRIDYRRDDAVARITSPFGLSAGPGTAAPPRLAAVADAWSAAAGPVAIGTVMGGWSAARVR